MKKFGLAVLALVAFLVGAYWILFPTHTYRYRLAIAAEVDGEVRSAWSVIEVSMTRQPNFGDMSTYSHRVHAEAVYLDLGDSRNVVATLSVGPTGNDSRLTSVVTALFDLKGIEEVWSRLAYTDEARKLTGEYVPTLVTFPDPTDPATAHVVMPDEFPSVFGEDVRFLGATIQMTRDPVTETIEAQLPWLPEMRERLKEGGELRHPKQLNVLPSLFVRR